MVDTPVREGDVLAGKYRVDRVLGTGNMGVVVAATHVDLGQRVALKFMLPGKENGPEQRQRFLREARAAVRLRSQHVARVLDVGTLENESPYIVMEFLEGRDLADTLRARGPLPFDEAVEYVLQACEAVGEAHAAGIVHRDLKPANLFLTVDVGGLPCIKVLDFGISKFSDADMTLTQEAQALGSPLYMSPEQMNSSKDVDARSDVWALGTILYQLVAGKTPYHADTVQQLCARVLFGQATPLADLRRDAPPGFEAVIARCIERDRERRLSDVAALAAALAPFAPSRASTYVARVARVLGISPPPVALAAPPPAPEPMAPASSASGGAITGRTIAAVMSPQGTAVMPGLASAARASSPALVASSPNDVGSSPNIVASPPNMVGSSPNMVAASSNMVAPVVAQTGIALASSQLAVQPAVGAPPKAAGRGLLVAGVVLAIAVPAGLFAVMRTSGSRGVEAPLATAQRETPPAAVASSKDEPVVSPGASAVVAATAASADPAAPSASATVAPAAATVAPAAKGPALPRSPGKAAAPARAGAKGAPAVSYDERQ
ncbi:Serine/threonine-protein kinase pkn3 [Minicystis rosea]|nr:Serine/threonine-protein kinase pkn3 [Minicystis rosea]